MIFHYEVEPYYSIGVIVDSSLGWQWRIEERDASNKPVYRDRFGQVIDQATAAPGLVDKMPWPWGNATTEKRAYKQMYRAMDRFNKRVRKLDAKYGNRMTREEGEAWLHDDGTVDWKES